MFANPVSFGMGSRSTGSFQLPQLATERRSRGSLTVDEAPLDEVQSPWRLISGSIGSFVGAFFRELTVTASAHTIFGGVAYPIIAVQDLDDSLAIVERSMPTGVLDVPEVLTEIERITGMNKTRIAVDLFGVSKQAYNLWERGLSLAPENLKRVFDTREVLLRASSRHPSKERMRAWLHTPRGARAERPIDLLKVGEFGRARMLAISTAPTRSAPVADWILKSTPDPWTTAQQRRRDKLSRDNVSSKQTTDG
jgi:uncharacterized protein (DUF2384 family)